MPVTLLVEVKQQLGALVPGWVTVPVVLHVDGLCMSLTLGCSTFLDLSETYPQFTTRDTHSVEILLPLILEILKP